MASNSKIEWTQTTWNPVTGCSKISAGCKNCYAERMAYRLQTAGNPRYKNGFSITLHDDLLEVPLSWRKSRLVFVNSMSDLFHEEVPISFIKSIFDIMRSASQHTFQVLTKRSNRLSVLAQEIDWPENVWMGVSVETDQYISRINDLRLIPTAVRFVSFEPLLGPIKKVSLDGIDWVIVGGESGPGARPMQFEWAKGIRNQCSTMKIPFFFKQWGGVNKKQNGRMLEGRTWNQMPHSMNKQLYLAI